MKFLLISFLFSLCITHHNDIVVEAFATGAGGCATGGAVDGAHLSYTVTTGSLMMGNFELFLDGTTALSPDTPTMIDPTLTYNISIVPSNGATFRGVLFRAGDVGTTIEPGINAQYATACADVSGVTHMDNTNKTEFTATIGTDGTETTALEVTIVVANSATAGSIYYYDLFVLQPIDAIPTATPIVAVESPTTMVEAPTAPKSSPVKAPVTAPTTTSWAVPTTSFIPTRALLIAVTAVMVAI